VALLTSTSLSRPRFTACRKRRSQAIDANAVKKYWLDRRSALAAAAASKPVDPFMVDHNHFGFGFSHTRCEIYRRYSRWLTLKLTVLRPRRHSRRLKQRQTRRQVFYSGSQSYVHSSHSDHYAMQIERGRPNSIFPLCTSSSTNVRGLFAVRYRLTPEFPSLHVLFALPRPPTTPGAKRRCAWQPFAPRPALCASS